MRGLLGVILPVVLAFALMGVSACDLLQRAEGPRLEVLSPGDFATVQLGESVDVVSTATDPQGVTRVELYVGEGLYRTDGCPTPEGETSWTLTQTWWPTAPGHYTLTIVAYNGDGLASTPWAVAIEVAEGPATAGTPIPTIPAATTTPAPGATSAAPSTGTVAPPPPPTGTMALPPPATGTAPPPPLPTSTLPPVADLYIADFSVNPEQLSAGQSGELRVVVRNGGGAPSGSYNLAVTSTALGIGELGWRADALAPGEERVFAAGQSFSYPGAGTVVATIRISPGDQDANEENNTMEVGINVSAALPDLYIYDLVIRPPSLIQGHQAWVTILIKNQGGEAGSFRVRWRSGEAQDAGCSWEVDSLIAASERDVSCEYIYDGSGDFDTWAAVNEDGQLDESDDSNNRADLRVSVQPVPLPDLYIAHVALNPTSPQVGQEVQVSVSLVNGGSGDAGPFTVTWKSDPNTIGCSWPMDGLAAGRTTGLTCTYTYTYPHSGQSTYTEADANGDVHESDEDNNVRYLRVNVRPAA
jgi:hypothetical protein